MYTNRGKMVTISVILSDFEKIYFPPPIIIFLELELL
jgi:hypothetical protein